MVNNPVQKLLENRDAAPDEAKFFWSGGPVEVAERTWFVSLLSGVTAFETDQGLVLVDAGAEPMAPTLAGWLRQKTSAPVHTAIYTHGHVDHAFGLGAFLLPGQAPPRVVAHRATLDRFGRYERTRSHNRTINARQFGGSADSGAALDLFHRPALLPDTLFDDQLTLSVGGIRFEVRHCRGETDDHAWVLCPERRVLCPGDLFIYAVPNAGNPQKAQRYPWDWARGLREMAAFDAVSLCPGHGGPVVGDPNKLRRMLLETAEYLELVVERTLAALEAGSPPHTDVVHAVELPESDSPWLAPVYDEPEFIVRNVLRFFAGWWSGRPSELKPAPRQARAREVAALAGGAERLVERAEQLAAAGDLRLATHLADFALEAEPESPAVSSRVAELYEQRAALESSLMATNLFAAAAEYARSKRPFV
jgi:glyoxylase-like metal-dependent hydrolase (beta-lactamase superfamily II)